MNRKLSRLGRASSKLFLKVSRYKTDGDGKIDLEHFRNEVFHKLVVLFITIGLFPICYGAYLFFRENYFIAGILELSSYIIILILLLSNRITVLMKRYIFILCIYLLGLMLLFVVGPMGAGLLVIYSTFGLASCILSKRQNIFFIFISLFIFIVISVLLHLGLLDHLAIDRYRESWYIVAISVQSMGTLFVLIINNLFSNIEKQIDEIEKSAKLIEESERSKSILISNLPGMAYKSKCDKDWTMKFVSDGCLKLTGYVPDSLINNKDISFNNLITPKYRELVWNEWKRVLADRTSFKYEYEITAASGEQKWVLELGEGVYDNMGHVEMLEGIILDISDRKEIENKLVYTNEHDRWTGLYNRDYLESYLEKDGKQNKRSKRALIVVNLTPLQSLTVNYGFHYIQSLMRKVVETLEAHKTDERLLFKTYENQFTFYQKNYKDTNELSDFSATIAYDLKELLITERVGGGIGIIEIDQENEVEVDLILRRLLIASERSISEYNEEFIPCFYNEDLEKLIIREEYIRQELVRIITDEVCDELFLQYQPILDLKTNSACGFEALARLKTEKLGLVPPLEFISIAEKTKLIIPLGNIIIIKAFNFLNKLSALGYETISISINISTLQLLQPDFTSNLFDLISEMHVNPQNIGIEITESIFASDHDYINKIISKLRDAGLHVAIDDFGTGYSSLAREKELNVNCLKIDKYFIDKLLEDDLDKSITGDIITMAHRLGHCAIAEGVEEEVQKQYLLAHGCDKIQGYLVSRPLDEEVAVAFLAKQESLDNSGCFSDRQY